MPISMPSKKKMAKASKPKAKLQIRKKKRSSKGAFGLLADGAEYLGAPPLLSRGIEYFGPKAYDAALELFGSRKSVRSSSRPQPVATSTIQQNTTWSEVVGKVFHPMAGRSFPGVKIRGCQPLVIITQEDSGGSVYRCFSDDVAHTTSETLPTGGVTTIVRLTPYALLGPLLAIAVNYEKFVFRRMRFEYVTRVGSSQDGDFATAYVRDPDPDNYGVPTSYGELREINPSIEIPYRCERCNFDVSYDGTDLFYVNPTGGDVDRRMSDQGALWGFNETPGPTGDFRAMGKINFYYEVDMFFPTNLPQGAGALMSAMLRVPTTIRNCAVQDCLEIIRRYEAKAKAEEKKAAAPRVRFSLLEDFDSPGSAASAPAPIRGLLTESGGGGKLGVSGRSSSRGSKPDTQ